MVIDLQSQLQNSLLEKEAFQQKIQQLEKNSLDEKKEYDEKIQKLEEKVALLNEQLCKYDQLTD